MYDHVGTFLHPSVANCSAARRRHAARLTLTAYLEALSRDRRERGSMAIHARRNAS